MRGPLLLLLLLPCVLPVIGQNQTTGQSTLANNINIPISTSAKPNMTGAVPIVNWFQNLINSNTSGNPAGTDWVHNLMNTAQTIAGGAGSPSLAGNSTVPINSLLASMPALIKGLGALNTDGQNAGQILSQLFSDPRAAGIPSWIEALMQGGNNSKAMQNVETIVQAFSRHNQDDKLQTLLIQVFPDVIKGLESLNLNNNSSPEEIVSAIMADPSLSSSLSTAAQQLLGMMAEQMGLGSSLPQFAVDPNSQCAADLKAFGTGLQQGQFWSLQMVDAMGKLSPGVLTGQTTIFGDYDECNSISYTNGSQSIEGLFCGMTIKTPDALTKTIPGMDVLGLHLCVPKSCSEPYLWGLLGPAMNSIGSKIYGLGCIRPKDPKGDNRFLGAMLTIGVLCFLCALGTVYDVILGTRKKVQERCKAASINTHTYVNGGFISEKPMNIQDGGHVNGNLTNGNMPDGEGGKTATFSNVAFSQHADIVNSGSMDTLQHKGINGKVEDQTGNGSAIIAQPVVNKKPPAEDSLPNQLLLSFSVLRNGRKLLDCTKNQADISCLHGIRVLSITWVVLGHSFSLLSQAQGNSNSYFVMLQYFTYMVLPAGLLSVDTFFLLSGFLTAFLFLRTTKKSGLTVSGMILYYVHRIWRLTPLYALLLAFYIGIFPYLKKGPFQDLQGRDSETSCRDYWYHNILYINNVVEKKMERMCFGWSWYLSNDMQFSFIAPIVLIPWALKGKARTFGTFLGFFLALALILTHMITSGVISYNEEASMWTNNGKYMSDIYFVPWCRVGPYAVGLILGYIMINTKCKDMMKKNYAGVLLGWMTAWAVGLTLVYIHYDNLHDIMHGIKWNSHQMAAYEALAKVFWAVCVSWVIFACYTGYGGFVNTLLSWSAWIPLSRLSYGVYLVHLIVLNVLAGNLKRPFYVDGWSATAFFLAITVLSFLSSFVFSMLIEAPFMGVEKAVLARIFSKKKSL